MANEQSSTSEDVAVTAMGCGTIGAGCLYLTWPLWVGLLVVIALVKYIFFT